VSKKEWYFYIGGIVIGIGFLIYYNEKNVYVDQVLFLTLIFAPFFILMFIYTLYVKMDSKVLISLGIKASLHGGAMFNEAKEDVLIKDREPYIGYALEGVDAHGISYPEGGGMGGYLTFPSKYNIDCGGMIFANVYPEPFIGKKEHDKIHPDIIKRFRNHKNWKEDCCMYVGQFPLFVYDGNGGIVKYSPTAKELAQQDVIKNLNFALANANKRIEEGTNRETTLQELYMNALKSGLTERRNIPSWLSRSEESGGKGES
jgi:hypothetical protein